MKIDSQQITAHHEAGHAVIGYRLHFNLGRTTIIPDEDAGTLGSDLGEEPWCDGTRDADYIMVLFAGGAAQRRLHPATGENGCGGDNERAAELLNYHDDLVENDLRRKSEELVVENWAEIEAVASALITYKTMLREEIELICDAIEEGIDWNDCLMKYRRLAGS